MNSLQGELKGGGSALRRGIVRGARRRNVHAFSCDVRRRSRASRAGAHALQVISCIALLMIGIARTASAADDPLMKQEQGYFTPIPLIAADQRREIYSGPRRAWQGSVFRSAPVAEPQHKLQIHATRSDLAACGHDSSLDRHKWQKGNAQRTDRAQFRINVAQFWDGGRGSESTGRRVRYRTLIEMGIDHQHASKCSRNSWLCAFVRGCLSGASRR